MGWGPGSKVPAALPLDPMTPPDRTPGPTTHTVPICALNPGLRVAVPATGAGRELVGVTLCQASALPLTSQALLSIRQQWLQVLRARPVVPYVHLEAEEEQ